MNEKQLRKEWEEFNDEITLLSIEESGIAADWWLARMKEKEASFLNQKANQHDQAVRRQRDEELLGKSNEELAKFLKVNGFPNLSKAVKQISIINKRL